MVQNPCMSQEYRNLEFLIPWWSMQYVCCSLWRVRPYIGGRGSYNRTVDFWKPKCNGNRPKKGDNALLKDLISATSYSRTSSKSTFASWNRHFDEGAGRESGLKAELLLM